MKDTCEPPDFFAIESIVVSKVPHDEIAGHQQVCRKRIRSLFNSRRCPGTADVSDAPCPDSVEENVTKLVTDGKSLALVITVVHMCKVDHNLGRKTLSRKRDASYRIGLELDFVNHDAEPDTNVPHVDVAAAGRLIEIFEKLRRESIAVQMRYSERSALPSPYQCGQHLSVPSGTSAGQHIAQRLNVDLSEFGRHASEHCHGRREFLDTGAISVSPILEEVEAIDLFERNSRRVEHRRRNVRAFEFDGIEPLQSFNLPAQVFPVASKCLRNLRRLGHHPLQELP